MWSGQDRHRHQRSRRVENQHPVHEGVSGQCAACPRRRRTWPSIAPASTVNAGRSGFRVEALRSRDESPSDLHHDSSGSSLSGLLNGGGADQVDDQPDDADDHEDQPGPETHRASRPRYRYRWANGNSGRTIAPTSMMKPGIGPVAFHRESESVVRQLRAGETVTVEMAVRPSNRSRHAAAVSVLRRLIELVEGVGEVQSLDIGERIRPKVVLVARAAQTLKQ